MNETERVAELLAKEYFTPLEMVDMIEYNKLAVRWSSDTHPPQEPHTGATFSRTHFYIGYVGVHTPNKLFLAVGHCPVPTAEDGYRNDRWMHTPDTPGARQYIYNSPEYTFPNSATARVGCTSHRRLAAQQLRAVP